MRPNLTEVFAQQKKPTKNEKNLLNGENICESYDQRDYCPKYINSLYNSISKQTNNTIKKWAQGLNRLFSKEDI